MIKAGIIGATGYAGNELVRLLMGHKEVEIKWYGSRSYIDQKYAEVYQNMFEIVDDVCMDDNMEALAEQVDVIFTATPQGFLAGVLNEGLLEKTKIIDLSADFRIKDVAVYEKWYKIEHKSPQFIGEAVYGLCEVNRDKVKNARLVANPGCYTTCSILTAYPLVKEGLIDPDTLIIDAKSGTSGAGRGAKLPNLFCEVNENMKAYGVTSHRHTPEIEEQLGYAAGRPVVVNFTPHLVPMNRGILATEYATLTKKADGSLPSYEEIKAAYDKYYAKEKFVRVLPKDACPETKWVEGSNYVDIGFKIDERTGRIVMMGALDNLVKGAAGQAVQNMNLLFGFTAPILFALLIDQIKRLRFKKIAQTASYMPYFISTVVVAGMVISFIDQGGLISNFLSAVFGLPNQNWRDQAPAFPAIYTITNVWKGFGFGSILYISSITSIDQSQYESARIDGANRGQQCWYITLPGIKNIIAINLILAIGGILGTNSDLILLLYSPATYDVADVIGTYTYRIGIEGGQYSYTAAAGLFMSVIGFVLTYIANKVSDKLTGFGLW